MTSKQKRQLKTKEIPGILEKTRTSMIKSVYQASTPKFVYAQEIGFRCPTGQTPPLVMLVHFVSTSEKKTVPVALALKSKFNWWKDCQALCEIPFQVIMSTSNIRLIWIKNNR